jgi:hypothetical protein
MMEAHNKNNNKRHKKAREKLSCHFSDSLHKQYCVVRLHQVFIKVIKKIPNNIYFLKFDLFRTNQLCQDEVRKYFRQKYKIIFLLAAEKGN